MSAFDLHTLEIIIAERAAVSDGTSYTHQLIEKGTAVCAKKFGEEAIEVVLAAGQGDRANLMYEAADTLYHLLVLLRAQGISVNEVYDELERRTPQSGLAEKAARK